MDDTTERARVAARLLDNLLAGELSPETALQQWPNADSERDDLLAVTWHDLSHFAADADIRRRDPVYTAHQRERLIDRLRQIRERFALSS